MCVILCVIVYSLMACSVLVIDSKIKINSLLFEGRYFADERPLN